MKTIFKTLFVLFVVGCLAVSVVGVAGLGLLAAKDHGVSLQSPVVVATEEQVSQAPVEPNPSEASQPQVENVPAAAPTFAPPAMPTAQANQVSDDLTYKVTGNTVEVSAGGKVIAKIVFKTHVDNMPTEWLKNRTGVAYLYQSGIGNKVQLEVTLYEGGTFALDGDAVEVNGQMLGKVNDPADIMVFADSAGTYNVTGYSFGLAVGPVKDDQDKAGYVLSDRKGATNDNRPIFWLNPSGEPVHIN